MRGEICIGVASLFAFTSFILGIFGHVGQINAGGVPRQLSMVTLNVTNYGLALRAATGNNAPGLYSTNATSNLGEGNGLRQKYAWGLYSYCAYIEQPQEARGGLCSNKTFAHAFRPLEALIMDSPESYDRQTTVLVPDATSFKNSDYLGELTSPAGYLLLIGTLCGFLALLVGVIKRKYTFIAASFFSILGSIFLLTGVSLWTVAVNKAETVNSAIVRGSTPLGMIVSAGPGIGIFWASFTLLAIASYPYTVSATTYLKKNRLRG